MTFTKSELSTANDAHHAIVVWAKARALGADCSISVNGIRQALDVTLYRARKIQSVMHLLGLIEKRDTGRYHRIQYPDFVADVVSGIDDEYVNVYEHDRRDAYRNGIV